MPSAVKINVTLLCSIFTDFSATGNSFGLFMLMFPISGFYSARLIGTITVINLKCFNGPLLLHRIKMP